ncbi:DKNYY domain-containing protein [Dyadobacter sp. CY261]|uniref:DKNYY domain-containing protein n=1 Tax=Dyadobacter sp. CY261 TaxID=2907203 RepID=UPI001F345817|nr:DKNYY domain-containing protein [Dyadobacter sp. CY261]MCF0075010.1 DKNYY domain-containing protein [Dyadobacter sp. CY261]
MKKMAPIIYILLIIIGVYLLSCGPGSRKGYRIEKGEVVIYRGFPASRTVIGEADAKSFIAINDDFGKDKNHAFYLTSIIPEADPATFVYLSGGYSKDKTHGYSRDQLISRDGANFKIVPDPSETRPEVTMQGSPYAHDSKSVFKDVYVLEGADPATFSFVPMFNGQYLTYDRHYVYFQDQPISGADGGTFRKVSDFNFADKNAAWGLVLGQYTNWSKMENVDLATFKGIDKNYAKDKDHVYYSNFIVEGADVATFKETGYVQASDKNGIYSSGRPSTAKK